MYPYVLSCKEPLKQKLNGNLKHNCPSTLRANNNKNTVIHEYHNSFLLDYAVIMHDL